MSRYSSNKENDYQLADTFSWVHGNHTLKFGGDIRRYRLDLSTSNDYSLGFDGRWTGNPVADMLYGYAATGFSYGPNGNIPFTSHGFDTRRWDQSYFAQDDWRVTRNLTINLGLRWDYLGPVSDQRDNLNNFNFATGTTQNVGDSDYPTGNSNFFFRNTHDFGPRLGFAWSPAFLPHTVFRGGYGVFYMEWQGEGDLGAAPKNALIYNFNAVPGDPSGLGFANPFPVADVAAAGTPYILAFQFPIPQPYIEQWNFTIQHQLKGNILLEAAYVGNGGRHIWLFNEFNQPVPGPGSLVSRVPYPQVAYDSELVTPQGTSNYHALQLKVEKRFGSGLSFLSSYSRSKAIDLESDMIYRIYNRFDISQDHGLSDNDMPNRFVASWLYQLPVGRGRHYLSGASPVVNQILGGWGVGGITLFESGYPFTVTASGDPANWGYGTRPNLVGQWRGPQTVDEWFNTSAFAIPAQYTLGNEGRNIVRGPGINDWDLNIEKSFRITESKQLQFRSEFYNSFNHASFNPPDANLGDASFAVIDSATPGRIIQFALKLYF